MTKQYKSVYWKIHEPVLNDIKWFEIFDDNANQPIYVLDSNPKTCARYLTMFHIKQYIEYITYSIIMERGSAIQQKKSGAINKDRVDYMFYNQRTAYWFYSLYQEMQEIYKSVNGRYYKVTEYFDNEWLFDMNRITGPMEVKHKAHKGARLLKYTCLKHKYKDYFDSYDSTLKYINSNYGQFRLMYMLMGYDLSEFPKGAPAWYNNTKATIWTSFNKMTRLYYRIDTSVDGIYSYYYSVDNKNWIEITNVPMEMRNLIDGIIFYHEC